MSATTLDTTGTSAAVPPETARRESPGPERLRPDSARPDPVASAKAARLRYVTDTRPGIRREPRGDGFAYVAPDGTEVTDEDTLARIRSLAIPPAWTDVWICRMANGHLQATGRDQKGRKQYRYHARWRTVRDETKYSRLAAFAHALPTIRRRVEEDLARPGLSRERVLATVVRFLETTLIRIGNDEYARSNGHYGLTTLHNKHAVVKGSTIQFRFTGKSGKRHEVKLQDRRLAKIVRRCQDLPGQELFEYPDEAGVYRDVGSADVNDYLREISGEDFTAKDFRTWAGTVLAARALYDVGPAETKTEARRNIAAAVQQVADRLGNTPAICRKSYIHPEIIRAYEDGQPIPMPDPTSAPTGLSDCLTPDEQAVAAILESCARP